MFFYKDLEDIIFRSNNEFDKLSIITGYLTPYYIERIHKVFKGKIEVFLGMGDTKNRKSTYFGIKRIIDKLKSSRLFVYYTKKDVHAKIYIWKNESSFQGKVLIGSANFSESIETDYKEVLGEISPDEIAEYYDYIVDQSIKFADVDPSNIKSKPYDVSSTPHTEPILLGEHGALLSLLTSQRGMPNAYNFVAKKYDVHGGGGLNWGFSKRGLPKPNDAYIPIPMSLCEQDNSIFTKKGVCKVIWDDGTKMLMSFEGNNKTKNGKIYPKQISSSPHKSELGIYLRKRIGAKLGIDLVVPNNVTSFDIKNDGRSSNPQYKKYMITKEMLEKYGRYDLEIKNIGDDTFYFDFSVEK